MKCTKVEQAFTGAYTFQKCRCKKCEIKRQATESFWKRFDKKYNEYKKVD